MVLQLCIGWRAVASDSSAGAPDIANLCPEIDIKAPGVQCNKRDGDGANLGADPSIQRVIKTLGLEDVRIVFAGCERGKFYTSSINGKSLPHAYLISYPLLKCASGVPAEFSFQWSYLAPITHELSHVLQSENAGTMQVLREQRLSLSIELGADFLSGMVFSRTQSRDAFNSYQQNLSLVGLYKDKEEASAHGTWEQRTMAFRRGAFLKSAQGPSAFRDADNTFRSVLFQDVVELGTGYVSSIKKSTAHVVWDKLSSCSENLSLYGKLKASSARLSACRPPQSALERALVAAHKEAYTTTPCILSEVPSPMLMSFSCFQPQDGGNVLSCIRPADKQIIADHRDNKDLVLAKDYMQKAAACGAHIDSMRLLPTLFDPAIDNIATFEFGFIGTFGPRGNMQHGVASIREPGKTAGVEAIEYISAYAGNSASPVAANPPAKRTGNWWLEVDNDTKITDRINTMLEEKNAHAHFAVSFFSVRRDKSSAPARLTREAQIHEWKETIAGTLVSAGFERVSGADLRTDDGKELFDKIAEFHAPRRIAGKTEQVYARFSPDFYVLVNRDGPPCTKRSAGAILVYLFSTELSANDPDDYGSFEAAVVGVDECSKPTTATRTYQRELLGDIKESISTTLTEK